MGVYLNQPSMASGEIAPDLYGRVDLDLYYIALRTCLNFIVRQYGGAANRPGTKFTAETRDSSKKTRLIDFAFNEVQTYALEFSDQTMRVIKNGAEVLETAKNLTGITQASPGVFTSNAHGFSNGDDVYFASILGMVELNGRSLRVAGATANTFTLTDYLGNAISTAGYAAYISGGTVARIYTLATPFLEADLLELNYAQSNDVLTIVHPSYYPRDITRTGHAAWTLAAFDNKEGPFKTINDVTANTVIASGTTGAGITITAAVAIFDATMVGELFYIEQKPNDATPRWEVAKAINAGDIRRSGPHYYKASNSATTGTWRPDHIEGTATDGNTGVTWEYLHSGFGIVKFTAFTNTTHMTATVIKTLPDNTTSTATDIWARAAWSVAQGYPAADTYFKQRMGFGGTVMQPNGLWLSGIGARTFFGKNNPILDDDAIIAQLDTSGQNAIRQMVPMKQLLVMTSNCELLVGQEGGIISAVDPLSAEPQSYSGCSKVHPIVVDRTVIFADDYGSSVRSLELSNNANGYSGIELSARSPHLFKNAYIVNWAYHRKPFSVIWSIMSDGGLLGFTFMEEQKVYAWHRHATDGVYESVCCIREGRETATYFVVKRTVNGHSYRYIERMASRTFTDIQDAYFVDCGLSYDGRNTAATTVTITGGTTWDNPETLTVTASASLFKATDVGDAIAFTYYDANGVGIVVRLTITAYTSATVVSAIPSKLVPVAYQGVAFTTWAFARNTFRPLDHLEGKTVAILADGNVVRGKTVTGGKVTLDDPAAVVHIGLPYVADLETLDIAKAAAPGDLKGKTVIVPRVFVGVQESRGLMVGTSVRGFSDLQAAKQRDPALGYDLPIPPETDIFEVGTNSNWSKHGRVCIRQSDPLPLTITSITPEVQGGLG